MYIYMKVEIFVEIIKFCKIKKSCSILYNHNYIVIYKYQYYI